MRSVDAFGEAQEADGRLAFKVIADPHHGAFGHIGVARQDLFHRAGRQPVARDVDHVIGARHDPDIAVLINPPRIASLIIAGEGGEVGFAKAVFGVPQAGQGAGG